MTGIDWVILGAVVLLALFGWAQGFVAGALALAGFAAGAWLGTRIAPLVLEGGRESAWAPARAGLLAHLRSDRRRPGSGADRLRGAARRVGARRGCAAGGAGHTPRRP